MRDAVNYVRWIFSELIAPHLGRSVLEIGSGIGTYSPLIAADPKVVDPVKVTVTVFSPGERAVLSLASERKRHALVNEWRAHDNGRDVLGLETVSVPELLVAVCYAGSLGKNEALRLLRKLVPITSPQLMLDATRLIGEVPT